MDEEYGVLAVFAMAKEPQKSIKMSYFKVAMKRVGFGRDLTNNRALVESDSEGSEGNFGALLATTYRYSYRIRA